ncbi:hypothetical protein P3670_24775, partial [Vibrio parahaemolyticus]|nr:hypothetical protein [Vibrio parahaemolyticus]
EFAEKLLDTFDSEVAFRDCISKSYYADFHTVQQSVSIQTPAYKNMGSHQRLITSLEESHGVESKDMKNKYRQLAYYLKSRKIVRARVDYQLGVDVTKEDAANAIKESRRLQDLCSNIRKKDEAA